jgi:hypothetical protein
MPRRYFHRTDLNQNALVKVLRKLGLRVHCWGEEADLIVQHQNRLTVLCEVRPEGMPRKARKGRQEKFHEVFEVVWLQTVEDCMDLYKQLIDKQN